MRPSDLLRFATTSVIRHKRRSILSIVGVMVGVVAVIILTALGEGARRYVMGQFQSLGSNLLIVLPGKTETTGAFPGVSGVPNDLSIEDAMALSRELRQIRTVTPITLGNETIANREKKRQTIVIGTNHNFLFARNLSMRQGRFLPAGEMDRGDSVAILGSLVASELFPQENPLGKVIRVGDWRMRVIGILDQHGNQMALNIDEVVLIPVASAMRIFNQSSLFRILLEVQAYADTDKIKRSVTQLLEERHEEEDFTIISEESVVASLSNILSSLTAAVGGIAAISLAVAGIGIMNLMLVSVSERTAEVGLLKAMGASRRQILLIFLSEATVLVVVGALCGLILGWIALWAVLILYPNFPAAPPLWAVIAVLVTTLLSGLLFGALPARRASRLDPVASLGGR